MTNEKKFSIPEAEIVKFRSDDIIVTSLNGETDIGGGNDTGIPWDD